MGYLSEGRGESEKEEGGKHKDFSVFVRNLPGELDQFGLRGIFQKVGRVWDAYIPRRNGWCRQVKFGFVRFCTIKEAERSIQRFNGVRIRGSKLYVTMAKPRTRPCWMINYARRRDHKRAKDGKEWRPKGSLQRQESVRSFDEDQALRIKVVGQREDEKVEWLRRSLVCTAAEPRDLATLSSAILHGFGHYCKLSALSSLKFILTFHTEEEMEEAWKNQTELLQWFVLIKK